MPWGGGWRLALPSDQRGSPSSEGKKGRFFQVLLPKSHGGLSWLWSGWCVEPSLGDCQEWGLQGSGAGQRQLKEGLSGSGTVTFQKLGYSHAEGGSGQSKAMDTFLHVAEAHVSPAMSGDVS